MMYLNVRYVIGTRSYEFFVYAESHWKYHTFEGYYICSFSKLRHKVHEKVGKCSLPFPLQNCIVTFYKNCTKNMSSQVNTILLQTPIVYTKDKLIRKLRSL